MAQFYDTLIVEYIKNPGYRGLGLDKLAERDFEYEMISYDYISEKKKLSFEEVDLDKAAIYSGEDVYVTNLLFQKQTADCSPFSLDLKERITSEGDPLGQDRNDDSNKYEQNRNDNLVGGDNKTDILIDIELPLLEVLVGMEIDGVKIDRDRLKGIGLILENEIASLEKDIFHDADREFNIKSPKQVGEVLFDDMQLPKGKKTKTGWSVSAEVLQNLALEYPIAQKIVDYRHYSKILSTYIDGLTELLDDNELVHTSYNQTVTTTGRLSSTKPNLQNIPSSDGVAGQVREAFVSRWNNGKILAFDYSQVEVRLLAIMSEDKNLLDAFANGIDIHHKTAEFIFSGTTINGSERKVAKAVNFGVIYGISPFGLAKMIGISQKDARVYIDKFYENYPKVREFFDKVISDCEKNGYVKTMFNRKRFIKSINDKNALIKKAAEREAINMPIQGTSADIIKISMIKVANFLKENNLKSKMIMQVHDELVFDVYDGEENILKENITNIMQGILKNAPITLKVDYNSGNNWREAK